MRTGLALALLNGVLLGAHFLRADELSLTVLSLGAPLLLLLGRRWAVTVVQAALFAGSLEWLRTLMFLTQARRVSGEPFLRLVLMLGVVTAFAAASAYIVGRAPRAPHAPRPHGLPRSRSARFSPRRPGPGRDLSRPRSTVPEGAGR